MTVGSPPVERVCGGHDIELAATSLSRAAMRPRQDTNASQAGDCANVYVYLWTGSPREEGDRSHKGFKHGSLLSSYRRSISKLTDAPASQELKC